MMECWYLLLVVFHFTAGCSLSGDSELKVIRGNRGGSVLLPCSCTDLQTEQSVVSWKRLGDHSEVISSDQYRGRYQLFNEDSPANLSLLISDLREEDDGDYRCQSVKEYRDFRLKVKGCDLVMSRELEEVTGFLGESVVLPCSCTDLQIKPNNITWKFIASRIYTEIYPKQTGHHRDRLRLTNKNPADLSLLISHLTEEDQDDYMCSVQGDEKYVRLKIKARETPADPTKQSPEPSAEKQKVTFILNLVLGILMAFLLLILGVVGFTCWRRRGRRSGQNVTNEGHHKKQETQTVNDDVMYSTVVHRNTVTPAAPVQINTEDQTVYASIKNN